MSKTVKDVMTPTPLTLSADSSVSEAARAMRDKDIGVVLVVEDNQRLCGVITDRDIVVRAVAAGVNPDQTPLSKICSHELAEISPNALISDAVSLMRKKAIRRIPVMEGGKPVGIVSIGDLAIAQDPNSALGSISAAPPNH
jgi:CBS domain-containing protein